MEWSLQTRDLEELVVPTARELGVGIVAYSPLGRGFLSHSFAAFADLDEGDWRKKHPRFRAENFDANLKSAFYQLAANKHLTPAQLALAWVQAQGDDVFPIPGTKSADRVVENAQAVGIASALSASDLLEMEASIPATVGDRYEGMSGTFSQRL